MIFQLTLIAHIAAGSLALIGGALAAATRKGSRLHIRGGKLFTWSMIVTALAAILLSQLRPNPFLMAIGCFTLYLTFSGWIRARMGMGKRGVQLVRVIGGFGLLTALLMVGQAVLLGHQLNVVLLAFGAVQAAFSIGDFRKMTDCYSIPGHAGRIGGAFIAAVTALLVVNSRLDFLPPLVIWLAPSGIGTLLIVTGVRKWKQRMGIT